MPAARFLLPDTPPTEYTKPTLENTSNGTTYRPTHPDLFRIEFTSSIRPGSHSGSTSGLSSGSDSSDVDGVETYSSRLVAVRDFKANEVINTLTNLSLASEKAYSSVQFGTGPRDHFELNSDLLFMNHSCAPSAYLKLTPRLRLDEWVLCAGSAGIKAGDDITFFYPSTEWEMAQPFDCACGAEDCLGRISGAHSLTLDELERRSGFVNDHIRELRKGLAQSQAAGGDR